MQTWKVERCGDKLAKTACNLLAGIGIDISSSWICTFLPNRNYDQVRNRKYFATTKESNNNNNNNSVVHSQVQHYFTAHMDTLLCQAQDGGARH
jgi:hypothetical protein